jgi:hypothetical protein
MRISGSYFERYLVLMFPQHLLVYALFLLADAKENAVIIIYLVPISLLYWLLLDALIIYNKFKDPKPLRFDKTLVWNGQILLAQDIVSIVPITYRLINNTGRWCLHFRMIEFHLNNGEVFYIIDKPTNFISDLIGSSAILSNFTGFLGFTIEGSKTLGLLIEKCPELEEKITERGYINS